MKQTRNNNTNGKNGALPKAVLMGLVGGARVDNKHEVTPETAVALTAGGHDAGASMGFGGFDASKPSPLPAVPPAEPTKANLEVSIASTKVHIGEYGAFTLKLDMQETKPEGSKSPAAKLELSATGIKGQPDSVKVTVVNQDTKERAEYSAKDIDARAQAGDSFSKELSQTLKKIVADPKNKNDGDLAKEIDDKFSGKVKKIGNYANDTVKPNYYKYEAERYKGTWSSKTTSSELDRQKADTDKAVKQKTEADAAQQQASQGTKQAVKNLTDANRNVTGTVQDAAKTVLPHHIAKTEHNGAVLREQLAKQDLDSAVKKLVEGENAAKAGKPGAPTATQLKSLSDAARQAATKQVEAQREVTDAAKKLADARDARIDGAQKIADAKKQVDAAKKDLAKADGKAVEANKAARDEGVKKRANSIAGKPDAGDAAEHKADGRERLKSTGASPKSTIDDLAKDKLANEKLAKEKQSKIDKIKDKAGKFMQSSTGGKITREVGDFAAKKAAKEFGSFNENKSSNVLAGGVDQSTSHDGNKTKTTTTIAQVGTEGGTLTYSGPAGAGASADWSIKAEAGKEVSTTVDLGGGASKTVTNAAYAGVSVNSGAKASISAGGIDAQASIKVAADATASHTEVTNYGSVKVTDKVEAAAHAEAGAKAGASLGFDGVNIGAKASAEAGVKAGASKTVSIGDAVDVGADVAVFAKAKAEAKADMNLTFFGKDGTKVKAGFGAEAAAGVGVEGSTGFKAAGGGGADVGAGVYVGKIGAKADADVGFKDGKLSADLNLGLAAGLGVNIHIKVSSNIGKAVDEAVDHIKNGNVLEKAAGVVGLFASPIVGFFI